MKRAKHKRKPKNGFTIVEVLIVIAIAGLIMMIIFLAVPAMQRNRRNYQRRRDVAALLAALQEARGATLQLPANCNNTLTPPCFVQNVKLSYYDNTHPTINYVSFYNRGLSGAGPYNPIGDPQLDPAHTTSRERVSIRSYAKCGSDGLLTGVNANPNSLAAQFAIETASGNILQCLES